jgi:hypothetical protein
VCPARSAEPDTAQARHQGHDKRPIQRLPERVNDFETAFCLV